MPIQNPFKTSVAIMRITRVRPYNIVFVCPTLIDPFEAVAPEETPHYCNSTLQLQ